MVVETAVYRNFRNIETAELHFSPGVNLLIGDNAQGKTNALEGIYCFACGKSFRGVHDRELLRFGESFGSVALGFRDAQREQKMELCLSDTKPRVMRRNGVPVRSSAAFVGTFRGVLFCPEHLMMIKGAPALRRSFLDAAISQLRPQYLSALADYTKLLRQRSALLKHDGQDIAARLPLYDALAFQTAELNTRIVMTRMKYIRLLSESVNQLLSDMTNGRETVCLTHICDAQPEENGGDAERIRKLFYDKLLSNAAKEFSAQTTLYGCHRDDIAITLNGKEAKLYASQGQDRSIALAMKLGEGELSRLASESGEYPVFLFDDVLSELDRGRRQYLMEQLGERQVIMTACGDVPMECGYRIREIRVENGTYQSDVLASQTEFAAADAHASQTEFAAADALASQTEFAAADEIPSVSEECT